MKHRMNLTLPLALFALCACGPMVSPSVDGSSDAASEAGSDAASEAGAQPGAVRWTPCTLHEDGTGAPAQCGVMQVPLDATRPDGPTIEYYFKRFRPEGGRGLRALWMLQGGPGASGHVFEGLSEALATRFTDVDYYMPDHRGTGRSTRIGCPMQEADGSEGGPAITDGEWPACIASVQSEWGTRLGAFNTTNAANDLGVAIEATRAQGQPVFVLGISYGTYLAHRFLQLFPRRVDGVVMDSIAPQGLSLFRQDEDSNEAARDFFAYCGRDAFCREKLGADPWATASDVFRRLKTGHCAAIAVPEIPTYVLMRRAMAGLMMDPGLRAYVAPIVHRLDRCDARDITALRVLVRQLTQEQPFGAEQRLWGWVLMNNIAHSEFNESPPPSAALLESIREGAVASRDITAVLGVNLGRWPVYTPDAYATQWAVTSTPMLMLQGGLDPATLLRKARETRTHFTGQNQHWVEFATASHTTLSSTPFVDEIGERRSCATRLLMRFIEGPTQPLDTGCVARVEGPEFRLERPDINRALFGSASAWE